MSARKNVQAYVTHMLPNAMLSCKNTGSTVCYSKRLEIG